MLKVKTYIKESSIPNAGIGCFADEFIPKGTRIWSLDAKIDRVFHNGDLFEMSDIEIEFIEKYAYMHNGLYYLCVDNARFFNHSSTDFNTVDPINEYITYAARDIEKDEEILSNYNSFGNINDNEFNMRGLN